MIFAYDIHNCNVKGVFLGFWQQITINITKITVVVIANMVRFLFRFDFIVGLEVIKGEKNSKLDILKDQSDEK